MKRQGFQALTSFCLTYLHKTSTISGQKPWKSKLAMPHKLSVPFKSVPGRDFKPKLQHLLPKGCCVWLICPWFDNVGDGFPHPKIKGGVESIKNRKKRT